MFACLKVVSDNIILTNLRGHFAHKIYKNSKVTLFFVHIYIYKVINEVE